VAFIAEDGLMVDTVQRGGVRVYGLAIGQHGRRRSVSMCARVRGETSGGKGRGRERRATAQRVFDRKLASPRRFADRTADVSVLALARER
jgi:hypothetical protein